MSGRSIHYSVPGNTVAKQVPHGQIWGFYNKFAFAKGSVIFCCPWKDAQAPYTIRMPVGDTKELVKTDIQRPMQWFGLVRIETSFFEQVSNN